MARSWKRSNTLRPASAAEQDKVGKLGGQGLCWSLTVGSFSKEPNGATDDTGRIRNLSEIEQCQSYQGTQHQHGSQSALPVLPLVFHSPVSAEADAADRAPVGGSFIEQEYEARAHQALGRRFHHRIASASLPRRRCRTVEPATAVARQETEESLRIEKLIAHRDVAAAATSTQSDLVPPWATVHLGSHELSVCNRNSTRLGGDSVSAAGFRRAQQASFEPTSSASRFSVIPRRSTFSIFREWLEEDHRHSRKAWGPRGQYPARRGIHQSAIIRSYRRLGAAAVEQRNSAEKKARLAVEAEVKKLSVNKTPQQQQEAYIKARQQASLPRNRLRGTMDEVAAKEEARLAAAEAAAAAASAAIAQADWPSRHRLRQQQLQQQQKEDKGPKVPLPMLPIVQIHPFFPSKYSSKQDIKACLDPGQPCMATRNRPRLREQLKRRESENPAETGAKAAGDECKSRRAIMRFAWSARPPATSVPHSCPPTAHRVRHSSAVERSRDTRPKGTPGQGVSLDELDAASSCSDEGDFQYFNPLEEVLLLLHRVRNADGYGSGIVQRMARRRASGSDGSSNKWVEPEQPARSVRANESNLITSPPDKIISGRASATRSLQQKRNNRALQQALTDLKFLPLEAFDVPEDYGEPSPRSLLQRCRSECLLRRLKADTKSGENGGPLETSDVKTQQPNSPQMYSDFSNVPERPGSSHDECSEALPSELALESQSHAKEAQCVETYEATQRLEAADCTFHRGDCDSASSAATAPKPENSAQGAAGKPAKDYNNSGGEAEAEVLHFVGSSWSRIPCSVLQYDPERRRFLVQLRDGTLKAVRRLALRFCFETPQMQQQRLEACSNRRRQTLLRQQFLQAVNGLPSAAFSPLPQSTIVSIMKAAVGVGKLSRLSFPIEILRPPMNCLRERFLEATKLSAVLQCAENLRAKGKLITSLQIPHIRQQQKKHGVLEKESEESVPLLKLLQPLLSTTSPSVGRPDIGASESFREALMTLRKKQLFINPKMLRVQYHCTP